MTAGHSASIYTDARWYMAEAAVRESGADMVLDDEQLRKRMRARRAAVQSIRNAYVCLSLMRVASAKTAARMRISAEMHLAVADEICDLMKIGPGLFHKDVTA